MKISYIKTMFSLYRPSVLPGWTYVWRIHVSEFEAYLLQQPYLKHCIPTEALLLISGLSSLLLHHITKPSISHYTSYTSLYRSVQNANSVVHRHIQKAFLWTTLSISIRHFCTGSTADSSPKRIPISSRVVSTIELIFFFFFNARISAWGNILYDINSLK